jgi:hypothetical protein
MFEFVISPTFAPCGGSIIFDVTNKTSTEQTPAGADENNVFDLVVGQQVAGSPTDLVIQPSAADSYVNEASQGTNYGTAATMLVAKGTTAADRSPAQFNLSGIPAGSTINSATLELYNTVAAAAAVQVDMHHITGTWTETGVTWTSQPAYSGTADAIATPTVGVGWKTWSVQTVVQAWVSGTYTNYGFLVKCNAEGNPGRTYTFATRENATTGNRPILRVNYTPQFVWDCSYTGSGTCAAGGPKPVPDGRVSGTAMRGSKVTVDGANLFITYDTSTCTQVQHSILYGLLTALNPITPSGGVCDIGNTSPYAWNGSPSGNIWWVIVGDNGTTESSWGQKYTGGTYSERSSSASNQCGNTTLNTTGTCP